MYEGMREIFRETMAGKEDCDGMLIQPWRLLDARVREDLEEARRAAASTVEFSFAQGIWRMRVRCERQAKM
jgi:hypothetical protein